MTDMPGGSVTGGEGKGGEGKGGGVSSGAREEWSAVTYRAEPGRGVMVSGGAGAAVKGAGGVFATIFSPIRWLVRPFVVRVSPDSSHITFVSYSKLVYLWPFIPFAIFVTMASAWNIMTAGALGWVTIIAIFMSWVVLAEDVNMKSAAIIALMAALFLALGVLSRIFLNVPYLSWIHQMFQWIQVGFEPGVAKALGLLVGLMLLFYVVPKAFLSGRFEISSQEISQLRFMMGSVSHPRIGRKIKIEFNDLFELLLGLGGGQIAVYDAHNKAELVIPNVLFLKLFEEEIETVLESVGVRELPAQIGDPRTGV